MDKLFLTVEEVSRSLSIGRTKTYQLIHSGQIPVVRVGRIIRVPTTALQEWAQSQTNLTGS